MLSPSNFKAHAKRVTARTLAEGPMCTADAHPGQESPQSRVLDGLWNFIRPLCLYSPKALGEADEQRGGVERALFPAALLAWQPATEQSARRWEAQKTAGGGQRQRQVAAGKARHCEADSESGIPGEWGHVGETWQWREAGGGESEQVTSQLTSLTDARAGKRVWLPQTLEQGSGKHLWAVDVAKR